MDSLEKEELQLDCTQEELVDLILAKNAEIRKLRAELEKVKKNTLDDEAARLLEEIIAK